MTGVCKHCHQTLDTMERVDGEPAGWSSTKQDECLGGKCIAQRAAGKRISNRQRARDRRDAVRPINAKVRERQRARKTKKVTRKKDRA